MMVESKEKEKRKQERSNRVYWQNKNETTTTTVCVINKISLLQTKISVLIEIERKKKV